MLPTSVLTVSPVDEVVFDSSIITTLLNNNHQVIALSTSTNKILTILKPLMEGNPMNLNDEELNASFEKKVDTLFGMKKLFSNLEGEKKRMWDGMITGMINDLSEYNDKEVRVQEGMNHDPLHLGHTWQSRIHCFLHTQPTHDHNRPSLPITEHRVHKTSNNSVHNE